jgi:tetratricopeptide (TPR) repeat protein
LSQFRYKAFISYSHQDESWGRWVQRALESYRIPRRLVGTEGAFGEVPARLAPVFRDREDLSSAADLSGSIKHELEQSETLVVICSPACARSRWVNEEILFFKSLGRGDRIHALIVDGEPDSDDPGRNCFPPALVTDSAGGRVEPLAADARKWADGRLLARLKLIAGILGIRLDDLRRRDMQRRHRLWMASSVVALAVAVITSTLAVMAVNARNAAENRREHAEELVGYMVGDLRNKLATVGRLDILDSMGGQVTQYLETLDPDEVTDESLNQQARVWRQLGEVSKEQGKLGDALESFTKSRNVLAELYRRQPDDTERLFELGQAEFWVGYVNFDMGDQSEAERALTNYLNISKNLLDMEPGNPEWIMEVSYALGNMGWLEKYREGSDPDRILEYMQSSLDYNRKAVMLAPDRADFRVALTSSHADLADAYLKVCNLGEALVNQQRNAALASEFFEEKPSDSNLKKGLANAKSGLAKVQQMVGLVDLALANYGESRRLLDELYRQDPSNLSYRWQRELQKQRIATVLSGSGRLQEALDLFAELVVSFTEIQREGTSKELDSLEEYAVFLDRYSEAAFRSGDTLLADSLLQEELNLVTELITDNPDYAGSRPRLVYAAFQHWQQKKALPGNGVMNLLDGYLANPDEVRSCLDADTAARLSLIRDDGAQAERYSSYLLRRGYFEPGFVQFCRMHDLCQQ